MTIESVTQIIDGFRDALKEDGSDLHTFPEQGNLYSIYRSVALVIQEQNVRLQSINNNLYLDTATGDALDFKASEYNLTRFIGRSSVGSIIVLGNTSSISTNTILTDPRTQLQFQVQNRINLASNRGIGSIQCTEFTSLGNLEAGTELFSSIYPNIRFIVGTSYDPLLAQYVGNLAGGRTRETDEELRARIRNTINTLGLSTLQSIKQRAINIPGISRVSVIENRPGIGFITVYINNTNQDIINQTRAILERVKPIGTALIVEAFVNVSVNINLTISTFDNTNLSNLRQRIRLALGDYVSDISLNNELTPEGISGTLFNIQGVTNVKVSSPTSPISIEDNEILSLGTVNINFR